jgi:hypothetical protein
VVITVSPSDFGEQGVELGVAVVDADVHAAGEPLIVAGETVDERLGGQTGPAVAEVDET